MALDWAKPNPKNREFAEYINTAIFSRVKALHLLRLKNGESAPDPGIPEIFLPDLENRFCSLEWRKAVDDAVCGTAFNWGYNNYCGWLGACFLVPIADSSKYTVTAVVGKTGDGKTKFDTREASLSRLRVKSKDGGFLLTEGVGGSLSYHTLVESVGVESVVAGEFTTRPPRYFHTLRTLLWQLGDPEFIPYDSPNEAGWLLQRKAMIDELIYLPDILEDDTEKQDGFSFEYGQWQDSIFGTAAWECPEGNSHWVNTRTWSYQNFQHPEDNDSRTGDLGHPGDPGVYMEYYSFTNDITGESVYTETFEKSHSSKLKLGPFPASTTRRKPTAVTLRRGCVEGISTSSGGWKETIKLLETSASCSIKAGEAASGVDYSPNELTLSPPAAETQTTTSPIEFTDEFGNKIVGTRTETRRSSSLGGVEFSYYNYPTTDITEAELLDRITKEGYFDASDFIAAQVG